MRKLIQRLLDWQQEVLREKKIPSAILEAPTGYGKTSSGALLFKSMEEEGLTAGYIHVLPLRAIVDDLYSKLLTGKIPDVDRSWLNSHSIGYQMMDYIEGREEDKSPYFLRDITVTTFDSFIYNVARLPVAEIGRRSRHYEIPRSSILTSLVVLDEAHLYGGDIGLKDTKMFNVLLSSVKVLARLRVPMLLESATLPKAVVSRLLDAMNGNVKAHFHLSKNGGGEASWDKEYAELHEQVTWITKLIEYDEIMSEAMRHYMSGEKVLVMFNKPRDAMDFYLSALEGGVDKDHSVLLHGRLTSGDRSKAYLKLKRLHSSKEGMMAITTQVIEAGVDVSFDVLFTEAAPPTVLTQRAGRVARYGGSLVAKVYVFEREEEREGSVYDEEIVRETVRMLKKKQVEWRLPEDRDEMISYKKLTETIYSRFRWHFENGDIDLERVMLHPLITNQHLNRLMETYCGLVREPLLTGYIARPDEVLRVDELDPSRFIVLNRSLAKHLALCDALYSDRGKIIALKHCLEGEFKPERLHPSIFNKSNCRRLFEKVSNLILLVKASAYQEGLGIVI